MSRQLITHVIVADENGIPRHFGPGDKVPKWALKLIDNPKAWGTGDHAESERIADILADSGVAPDDVPAAVETVTAFAAPAKTGPGSSLEAWQAYATENGFEFDDDVTRSEIIRALESEGVATK